MHLSRARSLHLIAQVGPVRLRQPKRPPPSTLATFATYRPPSRSDGAGTVTVSAQARWTSIAYAGKNARIFSATTGSCRSLPARSLRVRFKRSNRTRSEEHTSELQSRLHLVCRL